MHTIKLVVIGPSGVGKTSLRGKYISGRFSTGYRATIGADFITKTLPHPSDPNQVMTLQIWDTAGQERFSSLSSAFFRGADAVILMFDVNAPSSLHAMKKWWTDFCDKAPVPEEQAADFCCVVVGNKTDLVSPETSSISESEALDFLDGFMPAGDPFSAQAEGIPSPVSNGRIRLGSESSRPTLDLTSPPVETSHAAKAPQIIPPARTPSIAISLPPQSPNARGSSRRGSPFHNLSKSRSRSSSRFYAGTMTSTQTGITIYHTPSSSLFDSSIYHSARSSPELWHSSQSEPDLSQVATSPNNSVRQRRLTTLSTGSNSSGSGATITPSLFAREQEQEREQREQSTTNISRLPSSHSSPNLRLLSKRQSPLPPERGPKLFFTSAKTGDGVRDVFQYVANRVVRKWEYEEWVESRKMHVRDMTLSADSPFPNDQNRVILNGIGIDSRGTTWCCSG